jgi:hypothetical protein
MYTGHVNYIFCTILCIACCISLHVTHFLILVELEVQLQIESVDFLEGIDKCISREDHVQFTKPDVLRLMRNHSILREN